MAAFFQTVLLGHWQGQLPCTRLLWRHGWAGAAGRVRPGQLGSEVYAAVESCSADAVLLLLAGSSQQCNGRILGECMYQFTVWDTVNPYGSVEKRYLFNRKVVACVCAHPLVGVVPTGRTQSKRRFLFYFTWRHGGNTMHRYKGKGQLKKQKPSSNRRDKAFWSRFKNRLLEHG